MITKEQILSNLLEQSPTFAKCWEDCKNSTEDSVYHHSEHTSEHIESVVQHLESMNAVPGLLLAGYLHDIGKPSVRKWSDTKNRYTFYGHEYESYKLAKIILEEVGFAQDKETVLKIVRYHMEIFHALKDKSIRKLCQPDVFSVIDYLAMHNKADSLAIQRGDETDQILDRYEADRIDELVAKVKDYVANKPMQKLMLTVGIAGSGKSTYLANNYDPKYIVNPDSIRKEVTGSVNDLTQDYRVWKIVEQRINQALNDHNFCILDAIGTNSRSRKKLLKNFEDVHKIALVFMTPLDVCKQRVMDDVANGKDRSNVPMEQIERQYNNFINGYDQLATQFHQVVKVSDAFIQHI